MTARVDPMHSVKRRNGRFAMRAAWYDRKGPARDVLEMGELPTPMPAADEVRVRIKASGINPSDTEVAAERAATVRCRFCGSFRIWTAPVSSKQSAPGCLRRESANGSGFTRRSSDGIRHGGGICRASCRKYRPDVRRPHLRAGRLPGGAGADSPPLRLCRRPGGWSHDPRHRRSRCGWPLCDPVCEDWRRATSSGAKEVER